VNNESLGACVHPAWQMLMRNVQWQDLMRHNGKDYVTNLSLQDWHISDKEVERSGFVPMDVYVVSI
jgi:hypothetical protein